MPNETVFETIKEKIDTWVEEFKKSPGVKALEAAFDTFSFLDDAYEFWRELFFPDSNYSELILEVLQKLWDEFHDIHTDLEEFHGQALIDHYEQYTSLKDPIHLDELLMWSNDIRNVLAGFINNWEARSAYRVAEIYNLIVPLWSTIFLQNAAHAQDKYNKGENAEKPDWDHVHNIIAQEFKAAIGVNQKLLGPYCFEELPNIPCYCMTNGKLYEALKSGSINTDEFTYITELVWQATERLREQASEGYSGFYNWFTIERKLYRGRDGCLSASPESIVVRRMPYDEQNSLNNLWRLEYQRYDAARIIHRSGACLTVNDLELCDKDRQVLLLPCEGTGSEYNYEVFVWEGDQVQHYWRSWQDGKWRKGQRFGKNVQSAPAVFQNQAPDSLYNYEIFVREGDQIQHYWCSWQDGKWRKGQTFGANVRSAPAVFQNRPAGRKKGNRNKWNEYEVFVWEGNHITYYRRSKKNGQWYESGGFGENVQSAPAVFQNLAAGSLYNYEVFLYEGSQIQHYWYKWKDKQWIKGQSFGENIQSAPAAFQNRARGSRNNYEIFVREGNKIQRYWRSWQDGKWRKGQSFGTNIRSAPAAFQSPDYRPGQIWKVCHQFNRLETVAITLNYDFLPPDEDDWYTYTKHLSLGPYNTKGPGYAEISSNAYVPGATMRLKFRTAMKTAKDRYISLRAHNGQYVCAEDGGGGKVVANRNKIDIWETFELIDLGNSKVAFRAHNGQYVCAEGGGGEVGANRNKIGIWETFELIDLGNSKVALRAHNGQYVCAEGGGGREIVANRDRISSWEKFELIELDSLEKPIQLSPANGQVFNHYPRKTTLEWKAVLGATNYFVEIGYKSGNKWTSYSPKSTNTTSYTFNFVGAQPGRWRVWAVGAVGQESPKTDWWEFRYTK